MENRNKMKSMTHEEMKKYRTAAVIEHYKRNLASKRFYCEICDKNFRSKSILTKHNKTPRHILKELTQINPEIMEEIKIQKKILNF